MRTTTTAALLALSPLPVLDRATAQTHLVLPATANPANELPDYSLRPLMQTSARVQLFFDATECGASTFTAHDVALRFDGPIPQVGASGPFSIQRLRIRVGTSAIAHPDSRFDANLTQPLATAFDGPWTYLPDPGFGSPHPWGAPGNSLLFPFVAPVAVSIPPGGWFVVEIAMEGNDIASFGFSHALVDAARTTGGPSNGIASSFGQGCSAGPGLPAATIGTTGVHAPGAAHFVNGQNLGANAPVFAIFGLDNTTGPFGQLPFTLPGTSCQMLTSVDLHLLLLADATGAIPPDSQAAALPVPANPAFTSVALYEQLLSVVPGANALGFVLSDARQITLGGWQPPGRGTWAVSHGASATAAVADKVEAFGYALRVRIQ